MRGMLWWSDLSLSSFLYCMYRELEKTMGELKQRLTTVLSAKGGVMEATGSSPYIDDYCLGEQSPSVTTIAGQSSRSMSPAAQVGPVAAGTAIARGVVR